LRPKSRNDANKEIDCTLDLKLEFSNKCDEKREAFHALPPLTRKSDGLPIGAVSGFCNMLQRYIEGNTGPDAATHIAVIFDKGSHTFRNDLYDLYEPVYNHNRDTRPSHFHLEFVTKRVGDPIHLHPRHMKRGRTQQFSSLEHVLSFNSPFADALPLMRQIWYRSKN
jgi:hypothetical protein